MIWYQVVIVVVIVTWYKVNYNFQHHFRKRRITPADSDNRNRTVTRNHNSNKQSNRNTSVLSVGAAEASAAQVRTRADRVKALILTPLWETLQTSRHDPELIKTKQSDTSCLQIKNLTVFIFFSELDSFFFGVFWCWREASPLIDIIICSREWECVWAGKRKHS